MKLYAIENSEVIEWMLEPSVKYWDKKTESQRGFISYCGQYRMAVKTGKTFTIDEYLNNINK